jgi:nucleoside-diphosphate-sugar epimerase
LIAGCGYLGLALCRRLSSEGWRVLGLRRSAEAASLIQEAGAKPITADLTDPATLAHLPPVDYVVSCQGAGHGADYRQTYVEGAKNLIAALKDHPPQKFLWVSSTRVYGNTEGEWVDESTDPNPASEEGEVLLEAEQVALKAGFPSLVVRPAGIYGHGRTRVKLLKAPTIDLRGFSNHIHVEDLAGIVQLLLEKGQPGETYLAVDDRPVAKREFYPWLAKAAGLPLPPPASGPLTSTNKRLSNRKIKRLGYTFRYPNYLNGFPDLLKTS